MNSQQAERTYLCFVSETRVRSLYVILVVRTVFTTGVCWCRQWHKKENFNSSTVFQNIMVMWTGTSQGRPEWWVTIHYHMIISDIKSLERRTHWQTLCKVYRWQIKQQHFLLLDATFNPYIRTVWRAVRGYGSIVRAFIVIDIWRTVCWN